MKASSTDEAQALKSAKERLLYRLNLAKSENSQMGNFSANVRVNRPIQTLTQSLDQGKLHQMKQHSLYVQETEVDNKRSCSTLEQSPSKLNYKDIAQQYLQEDHQMQGKFLVAERSTGSLLNEVEPRNELQKDLFRNIRRKINLNCKPPQRNRIGLTHGPNRYLTG